MYKIPHIWYNIYIIKLKVMNKNTINNFLKATRALRELGNVVTRRQIYGGCTELRVTLEGTDKNVVLYKGCRTNHLRLSVNFIK